MRNIGAKGVNICLSKGHIKIANNLSGNVSKGVRAALEKWLDNFTCKTENIAPETRTKRTYSSGNKRISVTMTGESTETALYLSGMMGEQGKQGKPSIVEGVRLALTYSCNNFTY